MTLLVGGEKMTHRTTGESTDIIASLTHPVEYKHGVTLPSFAGLTARHYLERFDAPRESLARVAVKNHENGALNPHAQFQTEIDVETALESPMIADPLRLYDFCPVTDGAAALLFCPAERVREYADSYAVVSGVAQGYEIYRQVTGNAGERTVDAEVGLACNVGGFGNCVITTLMEAN